MIQQIRRSFAHDKPVLPGLTVAMLLLSLPNILTTFYPRVDPAQAECFWMGVGFLLLPAVLGMPVRGALLLWLPLVALMPATILYTLVSASALREWAFVALMETDAAELARYRSVAILSAILALPAAGIAWWFIRRHLPRGHRLGWLTRLTVVLFATIIPMANLARSGWEIGSLATQQKISGTYPVGLVVAAAAAIGIRHDLDARKTIAHDVIATGADAGTREIHLLVIGESARWGSFQLNGYERETNPLLSHTGGVLSFQDVSAPATVTLMSVPLLLTPARAPWLGRAPGMPSVITVFKQAGYRTAWLSTQRKHGRYDTACSIYANDADEARFLSGNFAAGPGTYASAFDGELLQPVQDLIARGDRKLLIVLHTMGSHQHYGDRFPPDFNFFPAYPARCEGDPITGKYSAEQIRNLTNAYDNSIRYTDWVLAGLIRTLSTTHAVSSLLYISDHGQNRGDARVLPFAHGSLSRDVVRLPMIVWLSPEYRQLRPERAQALQSHLTTPFSGDTTFHTLADIAAIDCPLVDRSRSAADAGFRPGPRLLRNLEGVVVDYDAELARVNARSARD